MTQTPISPALISRITQAARYVISGVAPDAWFGPLQPLTPIAPASVAGRRFDYPTGYNLTSQPRSSEPVGFEDLRALADNCDILRSVIETRKDQVEAQEWTVRVATTRASAKAPTASDDQKRRIDAILAFLHSPDRQHGFDQWLRQILEDMFVIDAVAIYRRRNRAGGIYAFEVMDAATIKILLDDSGRVPQPPDPGYQQILKGVPAADYTREELMYLVHNPRSHKVYGYSHVEQVIMTVNILIRRSFHQLEYYRDGSIPDALIGTPKEWTSDQISDFQKGFDAMLSGNLAERRRARFLPGDFKYQEVKQPPLKDAYDEFLARVICYVFSISPEPFVGQVNRATAETSHARAVDEGLAPLMRFVRNLMNRIIAVDFASPDLEFAWEEARAQDPAEAAQVDVAYVGAGILTVNEVRANMGLEPIQVSATASPKPKNAKLHKDDDDSDEDDRDSDDSDNSDDDDSDNSDFDDKHPRWPAGTAGGKGGEFKPNDEGDATAALHEGLDQDAPGNVQHSDGTQVTEDDEIQNDAPASWGNPDEFADHFNRHASDFGIDLSDPEGPENYANQANQFLQEAEQNSYQIKIEPEGYTRVYNPATNTFGAYNPDGTTRTFFQPPEGQAYFNKQPGNLVESVSQPVTTPVSDPKTISIIDTEPTLEDNPSGHLPGTSLPYSPRTNSPLDEEEEKPKL